MPPYSITNSAPPNQIEQVYASPPYFVESSRIPPPIPVEQQIIHMPPIYTTILTSPPSIVSFDRTYTTTSTTISNRSRSRHFPTKKKQTSVRHTSSPHQFSKNYSSITPATLLFSSTAISQPSTTSPPLNTHSQHTSPITTIPVGAVPTLTSLQNEESSSVVNTIDSADDNVISPSSTTNDTKKTSLSSPTSDTNNTSPSSVTIKIISHCNDVDTSHTDSVMNADNFFHSKPPISDPRLNPHLRTFLTKIGWDSDDARLLPPLRLITPEAITSIPL